MIIAVTIISYADVYENSSQRILDLMNEIVIMFALYCTMCFSPIIDKISIKFQLGYISCIIVGSHLLVNLFFITGNTVKLFIVILRVRFASSD